MTLAAFWELVNEELSWHNEPEVLYADIRTLYALFSDPIVAAHHEMVVRQGETRGGENPRSPFI